MCPDYFRKYDYRLAEKWAREVCSVADGRSWTLEFFAWFMILREQFHKEALEFLNSLAIN